MKVSKKIIVIDDDPSNNFMCRQVFTKMCVPLSVDVCTFSIVQKGLLHIQDTLSNPDNQIVLFLDLNMPSQLSGWEVLDHLTRLPEAMQSRLTVFILSSSIRPFEKAKAIGYRLVREFIPKPVMTSMRWLREELLMEKEEITARHNRYANW